MGEWTVLLRFRKTAALACKQTRLVKAKRNPEGRARPLQVVILLYWAGGKGINRLMDKSRGDTNCSLRKQEMSFVPRWGVNHVRRF